MAKETTEQRRLTLNGRHFHFVSYEGKPGNPKKLEPPMEPSWFLMSEGKRVQAVPHQLGQDPAELDGQLTRWLEENVFQAG